MTYRTSWLESTGGCIGRHLTFGLHCPPKRGECYHGPDRKGNHVVPYSVSIMGNQIKSVARPPQPACDNADKCVCPLVALKGATYQSQL